jgi:hypothetical protein
MSTPIAFPLVNGVRHDFSSIELKLDGQVFQGFKSINYSRKRSRGIVMGNSPDPIGKTKGTNAYTADAELYLAELNAFLEQLGAGYGDKFFVVVVTYVANGFDTVQDTIQGCTLDELTASQSQGTDPLARKVDLAPIKVLFGGVDDLEVPLTGTPA